MKRAHFIMTLILLSSCSSHQSRVGRSVSSQEINYFLKKEDAIRKISDLKLSPLNDGECFADPEEKIYLTNIKTTSPSNYQDLKRQINVTRLENTASTEYYFCRITCLLNNRYAAFWTTLTDSPQRYNDDNGFICQGVSMEMVKIPGTSLLTKGPVIKNFSAFEIKSILPQLKEVNYKINPETKARLDKKAFASFLEVSKGYFHSNSPALIQAGSILQQIGTKKSGHLALLDKYLLILNGNQGKLTPENSSDYFVMLNILQHGKHLLYEKL